MNPFDALATFVLGKLKQSATAAWFKFLFEMGFSAITSFLVIFGSVLVSTKSWATAVGTGAITASVALTYLFRKESSRLTKGMLVVLPELEADKELNTDLQTIQKKD